jgi:mRNA-degrading endonuclease RelE of RelBE toxin-antitoxin system
MYFLAEIKSTDLLGDVEEASLNPSRWKVAARCLAPKRTSAEVLAWLVAMEKNDQRQALKGLVYLIRLAQAGEPLHNMLDKKRLHEAHEFHCDVSGKKEKIWRFRSGDLRVLFYYGRDRLVLLTNVSPKRTDKYTKADLNQAEAAVREYLRALTGHGITWLDD